MKYLAALGVLAFTLMALPAVGEARTYPWCAFYNWGHGYNCGFNTYAQCLATISGVGGFCRPNPQFAYHPRGRYR